MYFNAHLSVVIGNKALQTVVSVKTNNDAQHIGAYCDLIVPLNCRIQYQDGKHDYLTDLARNLFKSGDPITVTAWYDNFSPVTVFKGFVYDFLDGTPLTIKCLDYIYWFNMGIFGSSRVLVKKATKKRDAITSTGSSYKSITLKNLLQTLIDFVNDTIDENSDNVPHTQLYLPVFDMTLVNITFAIMSPAAILEWLKKELGLNISLSGNLLYVNIASNTLNVVKYATDRNVIGKPKLQKKDASFQKIKLKAWFIKEDGTKDSLEIGDTVSGTLREVFFYKVKNKNLYQQMAQEALLKYSQHKFNGEIETLLYPDCDLFWKAQYTDIRYPDRTGNYVIQGMNFEIDEKGYHRRIKLAFLSDVS